MLLFLSLSTLWGQAATAAAPDPKVDGFNNIMSTAFLIISVLLFVIVVAVVVRANASSYSAPITMHACHAKARLLEALVMV